MSMTEAEADQEMWEKGWGCPMWQVGPFACSLNDNWKDDNAAFVRITWNDGQCRHRIDMAKSITVADAKRQAAEWIKAKLTEWLVEADQYIGTGDAA